LACMRLQNPAASCSKRPAPTDNIRDFERQPALGGSPRCHECLIVTKSHTRRGGQSQFQCQKTVTQHGGYAIVFIYRAAISRRIFSCVVFTTLLTIMPGWRAVRLE